MNTLRVWEYIDLFITLSYSILRKLIIILNFHSQKQLDKVLRISNFTFYTECMNEEVGYFEELLGKQHKPKILQFVKLRAQARMYHKFSFILSKYIFSLVFSTISLVNRIIEIG